MIGLLRALAAALRRFFGRRAARKLLAANTPRGLPAPAPDLRLALRVPRALEAPEGEFWTLPLGAQTVRGRAPAKLLRLSALPPELRRLDVVRLPPPPRRLTAAPLAPAPLQPSPPLESRVRDLGVARPAHFRLDGELRLPTEVDPLRIAPDAPPPAPARSVRPRTPLGRAPLWRLRPRNFRVDPGTLQPANEGIVPLQPRDTSYHWVRPAFRSQYVDLPWMAQNRIAFIGPRLVDLFVVWWFQGLAQYPGGRDPRDFRIAKQLWWQMQEVKEQMLIRRDVKKDELPPGVPSLILDKNGLQISAFEPQRDLSQLIPDTQWVEPAEMEPLAELSAGDAREAYLQWRTLMNALEER